MITVLRALERSHSSISPSSFERVSACTMSHRLSEGRGPTVSGEDALLGTAAHTLLEWALKFGRPLNQIESVFVEGRRFAVDARMRVSVGIAIDWVRKNLAGRPLILEHQVRLPWGRLSGWLDIATADEPFVAVDFKHGYQVVRADTPQLGLYLMALLLERRRSIEGAGEATAVVIQPRAPAAPVRSHVWTFEALRALRDHLIDTLDRIRRSDLSYADGPWCRWCPSIAACPHLAAVARDSIATRFAAPELIANGEFGVESLDRALSMAPVLEHWIRQIHEVAKEYMVAGGALPGFKLTKKHDGGLTVTSRDDPRHEVDVGLNRERLRAALRSSVALGYASAARK
jgi:hypothetical protein